MRSLLAVVLVVFGASQALAVVNPLAMNPLALAEQIRQDQLNTERFDRIASSDRHILAQWGKLAGNCPGGVCPLPAPSGSATRVNYSVPMQVRQVAPELVAVPATYQRQWYNHDGMSLRQHAQVMHGHSTTGLSDAQVAYLNDHDHNSWGHGGHPSSGSRYRYPVAGRVVRTGAIVVRGTARVATAPVRFIRRVQPVRRVVRGVARGVNALRPVNIARRIHARRAARRCGW